MGACVVKPTDSRNMPNVLVWETVCRVQAEFLQAKARGTSEAALSDTQRLQAVTDIADGMAWLAKHSIVHRDLAARNVLVDSQIRMKVTAPRRCPRVARTARRVEQSRHRHMFSNPLTLLPTAHVSNCGAGRRLWFVS